MSCFPNAPASFGLKIATVSLPVTVASVTVASKSSGSFSDAGFLQRPMMCVGAPARSLNQVIASQYRWAAVPGRAALRPFLSSIPGRVADVAVNRWDSRGGKWYKSQWAHLGKYPPTFLYVHGTLLTG